ncbi:type II secretion system protein [Methylocucumis oryzae]|uniref:Prepilin-type N-terminal cleavage/methylation domain-containing protein n=1 Tax=Methylocucumis oryzae TaxID=1632867 RepID=A0A0F3ILX6_9GAMM|nr:type II secretion system protein [Methylocucumis oryzae]KJV07662.1 hypothetical protein VZ94_03205 [Methylocucumis oryzae]
MLKTRYRRLRNAYLVNFSSYAKPHHSTQTGFTLVEVLIAAAIVGSALALILQLFTSTSTRLHKASLHAHIMLAQKQIVTDVEKINLSQQTQGKGVQKVLILFGKQKKPPLPCPRLAQILI